MISTTSRDERNLEIVAAYRALGTYRAVSRQFGLASQTISAIIQAAELRAKIVATPLSDTPIYRLNLPTHILNCLSIGGIHTFGQLCVLDLRSLRRIRGFGEKSLRRVREFVSEHA